MRIIRILPITVVIYEQFLGTGQGCFGEWIGFEIGKDASQTRCFSSVHGLFHQSRDGHWLFHRDEPWPNTMTGNSNYTVDPIVAATLQIICAMLKRYQKMNYNIYIYISKGIVIRQLIEIYEPTNTKIPVVGFLTIGYILVSWFDHGTYEDILHNILWWSQVASVLSWCSLKKQPYFGDRSI